MPEVRMAKPRKKSCEKDKKRQDIHEGPDFSPSDPSLRNTSETGLECWAELTTRGLLLTVLTNQDQWSDLPLLDESPGRGNFVGSCAIVSQLKAMASEAAQGTAAVTLLGETGTGKEMLARFIHAGSPRADRAFIPVDCAAFSDDLFESQLFGHMKGAFNGAYRDSLGFIRSADGGSLFLDEIGELSLPLQEKFLHVLQDRMVVPVGDTTPRPVDIRVICATHRNLAELVKAGIFRQDLFDCLRVVTLQLPPLRDRVEDLAQLSEHFLEQLAAPDRAGAEVARKLSDDALASLQNHRWPGNVRELFNVLEHASVQAQGAVIELTDLPAPLSTGGYKAYHPSDLNLETLERRVIVEALKRSQFNRTAACKLLGMELRRLNRRISALEIEMPKRAARGNPNDEIRMTNQ